MNDDEKLVADDADLDGRHGDPVVRFLPKCWNGANMRGRRFSECPPDFLEALAEYLDWSSELDGRNAARARGWYKRLSAGRHTAMDPPDDHGWA